MSNNGEAERMKITARFLGPVMKLDDDLSSEKQNVVFATNGTGKTFLSRAFRVLDTHRSDISEINPGDIVSEESKEGSFVLSCGEQILGNLDLKKNGTSTASVSSDTIFHVFSSDYLETELKQKDFILDGEISHEIILGKPNVELVEKKEELKQKQNDYSALTEEIKKQFEAKKGELRKEFVIAANLKQFTELTSESVLVAAKDKAPSNSVATLKTQYEKIKSLPDDVEISDEPNLLECFTDPEPISNVLNKEVSESVIEERVKDKIREEPDFFQVGTKKFENDPTRCHFCTQELSEVAALAIQVYQQYFADEEAKTQKELEQLIETIDICRQKIVRGLTSIKAIENDFNKFKMFFSDQTEEELEPLSDDLNRLDKLYQATIELLKKKSENLADKISDETVVQIVDLRAVVDRTTTNCNNKISTLRTKLQRADEQRKSIQREACRAFEHEFRKNNETELERLQDIKKEGVALRGEVNELEQTSGDKVQARDKVAKTFSDLLADVFGDKYSFDPKRFTVLRSAEDMVRGGEKTLSDGEKTVIGFCYYLAQAHLKVERSEDYEKLFFVVDDPVSSVSFNYMYGIGQTIKSLRITDAELLFDGSNNPRPRLLLFTHNDYFYNLIGTNNVVKKSGLFQLSEKDGAHHLHNQRQFVSPHMDHMKEVVEVTNGKDPTFQSPNSVRCVLEGMWRFHKPDLQNLADFVTYSSEELGVEIKSMLLLNNLSHGGKYFSDASFETDIVVAANEALEIVRKLAPGQIAQVSKY